MSETVRALPNISTVVVDCGRLSENCLVGRYVRNNNKIKELCYIERTTDLPRVIRAKVKSGNVNYVRSVYNTFDRLCEECGRYVKQRQKERIR